MDIDLSVLRSLESEKDISMDLAIKAIEDALLVAYHKSADSAATARVEVDRRTGHVTVWAAETGEDGGPPPPGRWRPSRPTCGRRPAARPRWP